MTTNVNQPITNPAWAMGPACALDSACNTVEVFAHSIFWMSGKGC